MVRLQNKAAQRRRYRVNLIKGTQLYDTNEIAKLFRIHRNTVRHGRPKTLPGQRFDVVELGRNLLRQGLRIELLRHYNSDLMDGAI